MGNCMTVDDVTAARVHDTLTMKAQAVNGKAADANPASQGDSLWAPSRLLKRGAIKAAGGSGTFNEINVSALPKIPKDEATRKMLADAFAGSVLFSEMEDQQMQSILIDTMTRMDVAAGTVIITQSDPVATKFYVLTEGACTASVGGKDVKNYDAGGSFGELALLYSAPRAATVKATATSTLWVLESAHYRAVKQALVQKDLEARKEVVKDVEFFAKLTADQQRLVMESLQPLSFDKGTLIVRQGDIGNELYVIKSGEVLCSSQGRELARIRRGGFFGERSLITDEVRAADVVAVTNVQAYSLPKDTFRLILEQINDAFRVSSLHACPALEHFSETQLLQITQAMFPLAFKAGEQVYERRSASDSAFLIEDGQVALQGSDSKPALLQRGAVFGYSALLGMDDFRDERAVVVTDCTLLCLTRSALQQVVGPIADLRMAFRVQALRAVPMMAEMDQGLLQQIAEELEPQTFQPNAVIIRQGEEGRKFYIVESGVACITDAHGNKVGQRKQGEFFGEVALIRKEVRQANVLASGIGCRVLAMDRDTFERMQSASHRAHAQLRNVVRGYQPIAFKLAINKLSDVKRVKALGVGTFGKVWLIKYKEQTYALKQIGKAQIVDKGLVQHVKREKDIMAECQNPFLVNLQGSFQDQENLYLVMETVMGGELFYYLQAHKGPLSESHARFYVACVGLAFEFMQSKHLVYRDLKPENLLINKDGYLKIADFSFVKRVKAGKTYTLCGTPAYLAPEQILRQGHDRAVDWWALGVLMYEMLTGCSPFYDRDDLVMFRKIVDVRYSFNPPCPRLSLEARDLITSLLQKQPARRITMGREGNAAFFKHKWFSSFNWKGMRERTLKAPYVPELKGDLDLRYFTDCENENPGEGYERYQSVGNFADF